MIYSVQERYYDGNIPGEVMVTGMLDEAYQGQRYVIFKVLPESGYAWWNEPSPKAMRKAVDKALEGCSFKRSGRRIKMRSVQSGSSHFFHYKFPVDY